MRTITVDMDKHDNIGPPAAARASRLVRLGILTLLALGACIMTTIVVAAGRQGKVSDSLSMLSVS